MDDNNLYPILFRINSDCCGCTACYSVCPRSAINMRSDKEGFLYPIIDREKCIQCGMCVKVCAFKHFEAPHKNKVVLAVRQKKQDEILKSRSGGVFAALADCIIEQSGVVFGCTSESVNYIFHRYALTKNDCQEFRKSKYVQSDLRETYKECGIELKNRKKVLFSGTGCQIDGLLRYLDVSNIPRENLLTVDIVCHGVPSPSLWKAYVNYLENRNNKKIVKVEFRDKSEYGWASHKESFIFEDESKYSADVWTELFYSDTILRPSCHKCPYSTPYRNSDITLADYWGIAKIVPEFNDDKGVSLAIVHTKKGEKYLSSISDKLDQKETELKNSMQPNLIRATPINPKRQQIMDYYIRFGERKFVKKYLNSRSLFYLSIKAKKKIGRLLGKPYQ